MNIKVISLLAAGGLLAAVAWFVQAPKEAQADPIPEKDRETIRKGLDYLAGKQFDDGHWEGDGGAHPVAMTGLAGLALLMEGDGDSQLELESRIDGTVSKEKHAANVRKAADWLIAQSRPGREGLIFSDHSSESSRYMQGHGLATLFLAGVRRWNADDARGKKIDEVLAQAVKYIRNAQTTQGGWYDTSKTEGHDFATIAATVIQIQALEAAENAGIAVPIEVIHDGQQYLRSSMKKLEQETNLHIWLTQTAAYLAADHGRRFGFGQEQESKETEEPPERLRANRLDYCRTKLPVGNDLKFGRDELAHYYYAQAEYSVHGEPWATYRKAMFDQLRSTQNKDGSWPAGEGTCAGPVYAAAVWCTILQLEGNKHPATRIEKRDVK